MATFSHQQMSVFDALGQLTCSGRSTDWNCSGQVQILSIGGCKQAEGGNITIQSTAHLQTATQC